MDRIKRLDYAKKLLKFGKRVEASQIFKEIIVQEQNTEIGAEALRILIFEIELKRPHIYDENIDSWLECAINHPYFLAQEIEKAKSIKQTLQAQQSISVLFEFSVAFNLFYDYLKFNFLNDTVTSLENLDYKWIEVDLDQAKELSHNQNIEFPYTSWNDLREQVGAELNKIIFTQRIAVERLEEKILYISKLVENRIEHHQNIFYHFLDNVLYDIDLILKALYLDVHHPLIDTMLKTYQSHFYPCGWKGDFPQGQLCVINGLTPL